jgi:hypothetical protein
MEEAVVMVGRGGGQDEWMNGGMDESNGGEGRQNWGRIRREKEGEGKKLKNIMRIGIAGMGGWKKLL